MAGEKLVVVTGGTGALGGGVTEVLLDAGFSVLVTWVVERERDRTRETFGDRRAPASGWT